MMDKEKFPGVFFIGITGGVGSGKSHIAKLFAAKGATVIDADQLAHAQFDDTKVRMELKEHFGDDVIDLSGLVNRKKLGEIVFSDGEKLKLLNRIIHPRVRENTTRIIHEVSRGAGDKVVIFDVPLLEQSPWEDLCSVIIFVEADFETRAIRVRTRGWDKTDLQRREKFQQALEEKKKKANYVIDNSRNHECTASQVDKIWKEIKANYFGGAA